MRTLMVGLLMVAVLATLSGCVGVKMGPGKLCPAGTALSYTAASPAGVTYQATVDCDRIEWPQNTPSAVKDVLKGKRNATLLLNFDAAQ